MRAEYRDAISALESEWSLETGFLWQLRQGMFAPEGLQRLSQKLSSMSIEEGDDVPRRLVALLWYMPTFMQWQADRVRARGGDPAAYGRAVTAVVNEIERLLGVP